MSMNEDEKREAKRKEIAQKVAELRKQQDEDEERLAKLKAMDERHIASIERKKAAPSVQSRQSKGKRGDSALIIACYHGQVEAAECLLNAHLIEPSQFCNVDNASNSDGCTALMRAIEAGHADCFELLLDHAANVNAQDKKGHTPLHFALSTHNKYFTDTLVDCAAIEPVECARESLTP